MKITKAINLSAYSTVSVKQSDGTFVDTSVASFSATVSDNYTNSQLTIQDQELYNSNKVKVRKDKADFDNYVYNIQDTMFGTESSADSSVSSTDSSTKATADSSTGSSTDSSTKATADSSTESSTSNSTTTTNSSTTSTTDGSTK